MVFFSGVMVGCMRELGRMENNMEKVFSLTKIKIDWKLNGTMAKELRITKEEEIE